MSNTCKRPPRIQFILKKNECYGFKHKTRRSAGLWNSTRFIVDALRARGLTAEIIEVTDNNDIDREVTRFKPDICVIEALWVVPEKFDELMPLHPGVRWVCHLHSHMPFLALEGIAIEWIKGYAERGIGLIANSIPAYDALTAILSPEGEIDYLPNVYISDPRPAMSKFAERSELLDPEAEPDTLNVGCFGAIRPLKNQLLQALAAIEYARMLGVRLRFHINATRSETGGDPVLKNLRALFSGNPFAKLVECDWMEPEQFIDYLQDHIDVGMQVSLTETFNVVCADYATAGIPIVASKEVAWLSRWSKARDDSKSDIIRIMNRAVWRPCLIKRNQRLLKRHQRKASKLWYDYVWKNCFSQN